jgi:hypothetical protein
MSRHSEPRRKKPRRRQPAEAEPAVTPPDGSTEALIPDDRIFAGGSSLHELFQRQVRQTLDQSDLDEDAKQAILVAMSCPCCGAGGMNYTAQIRRRT